MDAIAEDPLLLDDEENFSSAAASAAAAADSAIPWSSLDVLVRGAPLLKFGRSGDPHFRHFCIDLACENLLWMTHKKRAAESRVRLSQCTLREGQTTDVFRRLRRGDLEDVSFSLIYAGGGGGGSGGGGSDGRGILRRGRRCRRRAGELC